ncbi:MAG: acetolactate decarboxylase [Planctomycetota bacterium]|nr:acetolactate decarboxylase [Planctomycetota bacterium]
MNTARTTLCCLLLGTLLVFAGDFGHAEPTLLGEPCAPHAAALPVATASPQAKQQPTIVFQFNTIQALLDGQYDADFTCGELRQRGNFGIGTFNALNGEMLVLNGQVWRVPGSGIPERVADHERTPFATVMNFRANHTHELRGIQSIEQFRKKIDELLPNRQDMFALSLRGDFAYVKTRSVPKQTAPYRRLVDIVPTQPTFERHNVRGMLIGFWFPASLEGVNVSGLHLHFLSDDHRFGGHLLECRFDRASLEICQGDELLIRPAPPHDTKHDAGNRQQLRDELNKVER